MLTLNNLKPNPGAKHRKKRLGNGESSGPGKTCGKGNKGQKARSGGSIRPGFSNARFRDNIAIVNLNQLEAFFEAGAAVTEAELRAAGLVKGVCDAVKLLAQGELSKALTISVDFASEAAKKKVTAAGGSLTVLSESKN